MDAEQTSPNTLTRNGQSTFEAALQYATTGWPVIPIHPHDKRPLIKWGKGASTNPVQIHTWFTQWPEANVALKTGVDAGLAVLDIDSPEGWRALQEACRAAGETLPITRTIRTARGAHLYFRLKTPLRSQKLEGLELKADKTYVLAPPSLHPSGARYTVMSAAPLADLPQYIIQLFQAHAPTRQTLYASRSTRPLPSYLSRLPRHTRVTEFLQNIHRPATNPEEIERIKSALQAIPAACARDEWIRVGMILKDCQLLGEGGSDVGLDLWDTWSATAPDKYPGQSQVAYQWNSFHGRPPGEGVTVASLYALAREHGWHARKEAFSDTLDAMNGTPADHILFQNVSSDHASPIIWPDGERKIKGLGKRPWPTILNVAYAIKRMQYECSYDIFKNKMRIAGIGIEAYEGPLSDQAVLAAYLQIYKRFKLDAGPRRTREAIEALCTQHRYDPVLDYFNSLQWDHIPRLDDWLATYCGVAATLFTRAIGAKILIAAVRRQYRPGTKFDQLPVLEGPQGTNKSTLLRMLAVRDEWFKDRDVFHLDTRGQQEALQGVLVIEVSELKGLRKAEIAGVQQFLSRQEDTARPAYGHYEITVPRRAIMIGTTNEHAYLQADENRRFWPVVTGEIDIERFVHDRDQIWAEAVARERKGESIGLERGYWELARQEQVARREEDEWQEGIESYLDKKAETSISDIWNNYMREPVSKLGLREQIRIAKILIRAGFERFRQRNGKTLAWKYRRSV